MARILCNDDRLWEAVPDSMADTHCGDVRTSRHWSEGRRTQLHAIQCRSGSGDSLPGGVRGGAAGGVGGNAGNRSRRWPGVASALDRAASTHATTLPTHQVGVQYQQR